MSSMIVGATMIYLVNQISDWSREKPADERGRSFDPAVAGAGQASRRDTQKGGRRATEGARQPRTNTGKQKRTEGAVRQRGRTGQ